MRGYGLPRDKDIEFPDLGGIKRYALKSSVGSIKKRGRGTEKNKASKAATRRYWKRKARTEGRRMIQEELQNETLF